MTCTNVEGRFQTARKAAAALKIPEAFLRREIRAGKVPGFRSGASDKPRFYVDISQYAQILEQRISAAVTDEAASVRADAQ